MDSITLHSMECSLSLIIFISLIFSIEIPPLPPVLPQIPSLSCLEESQIALRAFLTYQIARNRRTKSLDERYVSNELFLTISDNFLLHIPKMNHFLRSKPITSELICFSLAHRFIDLTFLSKKNTVLPLETLRTL